MVLTFDRRDSQQRDNRFRRKEGKGRVAKRRSFVLQTSWSVLNASLPQHATPALQAATPLPPSHKRPSSSLTNLSAQMPPQAKEPVHSSMAPVPVTWVSTFSPTHAHDRRRGVARKQGSGRSTRLRSFTLQLTLPAAPTPAPSPVPSPAPTPMPTPMPSPARQLSPQATLPPAPSPHIPHTELRAGSSRTPSLARSGSLSTSLTPGFTFTPMEGVPERQFTTRRPAALRPTSTQPTPSKASPKYSFTPVEGVPEKALRLAATSSRLACLARRTAWESASTPPGAAASRLEQQQQYTGGDFIRRADDSVLKSASASPEPEGSGGRCPGGQLHMPPAAAGVTSQPSTPFHDALPSGHAEFREMAVQTGISLRNGQASAGDASVGRGQSPACAAHDVGCGADEAEQCGDYEHGQEEQEQEQLPTEDAGMQVDAQHVPAADVAGPSNRDVGDQEMEPAGRSTSPTAADAAVGGRARRSVGGRELEAMQRRKSLAGDGLMDDAQDGTRKSTRSHQRPLEYWRNECKVFGRDHRSLPTVVRVQMRTPNPSWPLPTPHAKGNQKRRARTK